MSRSDRTKRITAALLRRRPLPQARDGDKDARGTVLVVAGSAQMPGPVILCAVAALRAGAGKLQIVTCEAAAIHVASAVPEALVTTFEHAGAYARSADAIVFGPGMDSGDASALYDDVASAARCPVLIDAGALETFSHSRLRPAQCVVTPHAGEMATLLGRSKEEIENDPRAALSETITRFEVTAALKGSATLIGARGTRHYENVRGHWGLATSGSGDTLAGIIGGILARGVRPLDATMWGVYLHALAGERLARRIGTGFLAREIPAEIPVIMKRLQR